MGLEFFRFIPLGDIGPSPLCVVAVRVAVGVAVAVAVAVLVAVAVADAVRVDVAVAVAVLNDVAVAVGVAPTAPAGIGVGTPKPEMFSTVWMPSPVLTSRSSLLSPFTSAKIGKLDETSTGSSVGPVKVPRRCQSTLRCWQIRSSWPAQCPADRRR